MQPGYYANHVLKSGREDAAVGCFVQELVGLLEKNEAKGAAA